MSIDPTFRDNLPKTKFASNLATQKILASDTTGTISFSLGSGVGTEARHTINHSLGLVPKATVLFSLDGTNWYPHGTQLPYSGTGGVDVDIYTTLTQVIILAENIGATAQTIKIIYWLYVE